MNYEDMDDMQINKHVARALNLELNAIASDGLIIEGQSLSVDYCNNPSHAWPIILENRISLQVTNLPDMPWNAIGGESVSGSSYQITSWGGFVVQEYNPLRAAMICFLKMKDAESD